MNNILVLLAAAIAVTWYWVEREEEDSEVEKSDVCTEECKDHLTDSVRAYARKYKRIDFIIGE